MDALRAIPLEGKERRQAVFIGTSDINIVVKIQKAAQGAMCLAMAVRAFALLIMVS